MFKKILTFFALYFSLVSWVFANTPVSEVFSDIDLDYKYYDELQALYDRWMISENQEWTFDPKKLLTREEFVSISLESSCKKCIKPYTDLSYIQTYIDRPFFDVDQNNKYFYCIAYAKDNNFVQWYEQWESCEDGTQLDWERPFCTYNNITLEEAISVLLRTSGILTAAQAEEIRQRIRDWEEFPDLALDVKPKNIYGQAYSFYPDFKKALEYELVEYDSDWNEVRTKLLEKDWDYIRPTKFVTKEEFIKIAYVALKSNSCIEEDNTIAIQVDMDENDDWWYDFDPDINTSCEEGIDDPDWYVWRFYNENSWEQIVRYGRTMPNYSFDTPWRWLIIFRVVDNCWNTWEYTSSLYIEPGSDTDPDWDTNPDPDTGRWLTVIASANPIYWIAPLSVLFDSTVSWWDLPYSYDWYFGDGNSSQEDDPENIFLTEWSYGITLFIEDSRWLTWQASLTVNVSESEENCNLDSDNDWIVDCEDICTEIPWDEENSWCPVFEQLCEEDSDCEQWFVCSESWVCKPDIDYINPGSCFYSSGDSWLSFWSAVNESCNSCPCETTISLDFASTIRACDTLIPAITSPDWTTIYGRWAVFQVR